MYAQDIVVESVMSGKLVLIDGNSIINRAFFGVPDLTNSEGLHTNAIYGFLNIMFRIFSEENPDYLVVAFDVHAPTFRHQMYAGYKGTRKGMPEELKEQVPYLKNLLKAMGITIMEKAGFEADDILGTLAKRAEREGLEVTLVSGDRDLLQIATDHILIRIPKTKGGKTEIENYHTKDVIEKYGLEPFQIIELKGLMGDASDNIPGVPKIGEKTATELLKTYRTIDNLKNHIDEITKNSIRTTLTENFHLAELSRTLATIEINADIELDFEDARLKDIYTKEAYVLVKNLGFNNLLSKFSEGATEVCEDLGDNFEIIDDFAKSEEIFSNLCKKDKVGFYLANTKEGVGRDKVCDVVGLALCYEDSAVFIPTTGLISEEYLCNRFAGAALESSNTKFITFDLKDQLSYLKGLADIDFLREHVVDIAIGAYICNPLKSDYTICDVANEYLNLIIKSRAELFGKKDLRSVYFLEPKAVSGYACMYSYVCLQAHDAVCSRIAELGMNDLFYDMEMPLIGCLFGMEDAGIRVLPDKLKDYSESLKKQIDELGQAIKNQAGEDINVNSPKQLGEVLFVKMGIPGGKKTKTGYSTSADILEKLAPDYPFVADILRYRALSKLRSTYTDSLLGFVERDGRIHSTFNQTITATGRISSVEPNLQNIPVRMKEGRLIRAAFVPEEGCVFVDADYSQIELRLMAHLSGDEQLIEAFKEGADVHAITASKVFKIPLDEVSDIQRRNAKAVNFGIIYGISAFGLSEGLNISRKDAKEFIDNYFETFPKVKEYLDSCVSVAKEKGYVSTVYGRRRPIPELNSSNFMQRSFGERVAMNAPIQGMAADIMKIAMIRVHRRIKQEGLKSKIILQVHDELMIEALKDELDKVSAILKEEMEKAADIKVPMTVSLSIADTWYDAK